LLFAVLKLIVVIIHEVEYVGLKHVYDSRWLNFSVLAMLSSWIFV
jgi:hypothetical protein